MNHKIRDFLLRKGNWPYLVLALISLILLIGALVLLWPGDALPAGGDPRQDGQSESSSEIQTQQESSTEESESETEESSTSAFSNRVVVTANGYLNIRAEGHAEAPVIGKIYRGSAADILERGEHFTKIKSGSVEGWVSNDYIAFGAEAESFALKYGAWTATVLAERLNVREEPNDTSTILATVEQGQAFIVEEQGAEWVKIFYTSSISGYLSAEYVKVEMSLGRAVSLEEEKALWEEYEERESIRQSSEDAESSKKETTKATSSTKKETTKANSSTKKPTTTEAPTTTAAANDEVTYDDLYLLAAICQAEAGYSYENCLPVGIVIMNRVRSSRFPNTVYDVIYQKNQFSPVNSGRLDQILLVGPCQAALNAAADALAGATTIDGEEFTYLFFRSSKTADYDAYTRYKVIGSNCFYEK